MVAFTPMPPDTGGVQEQVAAAAAPTVGLSGAAAQMVVVTAPISALKATLSVGAVPEPVTVAVKVTGAL